MVGFLEAWLAGKAIKKSRERLRDKLGPVDAEEPSLLELAPAQGARWLHHPDGSWSRWSYLSEAWEAVSEIPATLPAEARAEIPSQPVEWIQQRDETWERRATQS